MRSEERARARRKLEARSDHNRLSGYAERFFQRSGRTEWPTVRTAAKALRMSYDDVENAVDGDPDCRIQLTAHQVEFDFPLGEHFVEVVEEQSDAKREEARRPAYRCYCCGEPLGSSVVLVSYENNVDRVFLFKPEHTDRADEATFQLLAILDGLLDPADEAEIVRRIEDADAGRVKSVPAAGVFKRVIRDLRRRGKAAAKQRAPRHKK